MSEIVLPNKKQILKESTYESFKKQVLSTGVFADEIISDYISDMNEGTINGLVSGAVEIPTISNILKENGEMHYQMLYDYYS